MVTRMAYGSLWEFEELIEDFHERFEFNCVANNIHDNAAHRKKALFLGQVTCAKLKDLASPTPVSNLTLDDVMRWLGRPLSPTNNRNSTLLVYQEMSAEDIISRQVYG